jgi:hypothetical protein
MSFTVYISSIEERKYTVHNKSDIILIFYNSKYCHFNGDRPITNAKWYDTLYKTTEWYIIKNEPINSEQ